MTTKSIKEIVSGISDEAGQSIATQIKAHRELGLQLMELRLVDRSDAVTLPAEKWGPTIDAVQAARMRISCFGSAIANWNRPITGDFSKDRNDLATAIPRMRQLGVPFIRIMSWPNDKDHPVSEAEWREEVIRRMKELADIAEDGGVILAHENCSGWGGQSAEHWQILKGEVNSPALKALYDTGNPVTYGQEALAYYRAVARDVVYIHVKDAKRADSGPEQYCYCGEGDGQVEETLREALIVNGYEGVISIEPHLQAVIHTGKQAEDEQKAFDSYYEYGRRLIKLVSKIRMQG